jgi:signal transduction histidine kinase
MELLKKEHAQQAGLKNLNLYITAKTKNTIIICDEYSVTQIFANLIDNALKYTLKGEVQVVIDRNKKKELYVEVKDTGIGISQIFRSAF